MKAQVLVDALMEEPRLKEGKQSRDALIAAGFPEEGHDAFWEAGARPDRTLGAPARRRRAYPSARDRRHLLGRPADRDPGRAVCTGRLGARFEIKIVQEPRTYAVSRSSS